MAGTKGNEHQNPEEHQKAKKRSKPKPHRINELKKQIRKQLLKKLTFGAVVGVVIGFIGFVLLFVVLNVSSCQTASKIAERIAPSAFSAKGIEYKAEKLVRLLFSLRLRSCPVTVSGEVIRYCYDFHRGADPGDQVYEEGLLLRVKVNSSGIPISKVHLKLSPGVVSGVPQESGPYQTFFETQNPLDQRSLTARRSQVGNWTAEYETSGTLSREIVVPIQYYSLMLRSGKSITCAVTSAPTTLDYSIERGSQEPEIGSLIPKNRLASWNEIESASPAFFAEKRETARLHAPQVWTQFPKDFPRENYLTLPFHFCDATPGTCFKVGP